MITARLRPLLALLSSIGPGVLRRLTGRQRPRSLGPKRRRHGQRLGAGAFEQLERREVFNVTYHGGALLPHVEAQAVFLGSTWNTNTTLEAERTTLSNYLDYLVKSPYMDMLTDAGYNVGQGTTVGLQTVSATLPATTTDVNIRSLLQQAITLKLVQQPTLNRLYVVYMPSGITVNDNGATSQTTFLGYHGAFTGKDVNGVPFDIRYVVVPHPGTPNPISTSQGFTGAAEVQTLTLGGASGGTLTPTFNGVAATSGITRTDEVQTMSLGGTADGSFYPTLNGTAATIALSFTNTRQLLTLGGADGDTAILNFKGTSGSADTELTYSPGVSPAAADVLAHLSSIPALANNIKVIGDPGGPFTISFSGALSGVDQPQIGVTAGSPSIAVTTTTHGAAPTVSQVQQSLESIPSLAGNVVVSSTTPGAYTITFSNVLTGASVNALTVTGAATGALPTFAIKTAGAQPTAAQLQTSLATIAALGTNVTVQGGAGGPFTITIKNLGNVVPLGATATGGLTANFSFATLTEGIASDFDEMTSVTSHELAEAITDPDVNYKTLGWYDTGNNIEIGDIIGQSTVDVPTNNVRMGPSGYFMQRVYDLTVSLAIPDTTAVALPALSGVSVTQISLNKAQVSWTPLASGATGYRVYQVGANNVLTLLGRVPAINSTTHVPNSSLQISGLAAGVPATLRVEAYNAGAANGFTDVAYTQIIPALTAPVITSHVQNPASPATSAQLMWTSSLGAAGYRILIVSGTTRKTVATLSDTTTSATITGLPAGAKVTFIVEAFRGSLKKDSAPTSVQLLMLRLKAPVVNHPTAVNGNPSVVLLSWTVAPNSLPPAGYRIYWQRGTQRILFRSVSASATSATISGLPAGTKFQIEAFRGTQKADSAWVHV